VDPARRFAAMRDLLDLMTRALEIVRDEVRDVGVVFDDEDFRHRFLISRHSIAYA